MMLLKGYHLLETFVKTVLYTLFYHHSFKTCITADFIEKKAGLEGRALFFTAGQNLYKKKKKKAMTALANHDDL